MPYNEALAERIRAAFLPRPGANEKSMFGGIGFLVNGNMCCGVWKDLMVIRLSKEAGADALKEPHIREMDITGKPMRGWIFVEPEAYKSNEDLLRWINAAYEFADGLPNKR